MPPPVQQEKIAQALRESIVSGRLSSGARLAPRSELSQHFDASTATLQKAVDQLVDEGFLATAARRGTFVADVLPHLAQIALIFPFPEEELYRSPHYVRLREAAQRLGQSGRYRFRVYGDIDRGGSVAAREQFRQDIANRCLAGIVYASPPFCLFDEPWWQAIECPQVLISPSAPNPIQHGLPVVHLDYRTFMEVAADHLAGRGRQRLAVVTPNDHNWEPLVATAAASHGLRVEDRWVHHATDRGIPNLLKLLFSLPPAERPDALVVSDDSIVEAVVAAIAGCPVCLGEDLDVVALANLPVETTGSPLIQRAGFDNDEILADCLRLIAAANRGESLPPATPVHARLA